MGDDAGLEVANIVRRVVHELDVPDAALMRLFEPLQLSLEEIEPFNVAHDRGLPRRMRSLQIGGGKRALRTPDRGPGAGRPGRPQDMRPPASPPACPWRGRRWAGSLAVACLA